uniref:ABC transporter ATP-binding protein n=1 Tax=Thermofilum pendens TaxID=2269 RepID=A0A7C4B8Z0_THEPE
MSVSLRNIGKRFGSTEALKKVNLDVERGEFFVLLGPSGSGKSTLLRIIAGLEEPDEGEVLIDGRVVNEVDPSRRDVAFVFQNYALYPHMKVYDNIAFPLRMRKYPKEQIRKRVMEVAEMLGILHLLEKYPHQLSGGEQQRVALARAIVRRPKVFLLDEPLSNLDAKLRVRLRFELRRLLHDELKTTTIYVTHDQVEAMTMADRIAVINRGEIVQVDTPSGLYERPVNVFVAGFVGTPPMNMLIAEVEGGRISIGGVSISSPELPEGIGGRVIVGIRPQDIEVSLGEGVRAKLIGLEKLGGGIIVHALLGNQEITSYVERRGLERQLEGEESVGLLFRGPLYIFEAQTEKLVKVLSEYRVEEL